MTRKKWARLARLFLVAVDGFVSFSLLCSCSHCRARKASYEILHLSGVDAGQALWLLTDGLPPYNRSMFNESR